MPDLAVCVTWHNKEQAMRSLNSDLLPFCRDQIKAGRPVLIRAQLAEDAKTDRQRGYYHGILLKAISQQARDCTGAKHGQSVWKEHFRNEYLGYNTVTFINPITGRKSRRRVRVSTEDLGIKGYAKLIDRVAAYAVTELGVQIPMTWKEYEAAGIDPETGEVLR
jgi:hypothetical protein